MTRPSIHAAASTLGHAGGAAKTEAKRRAAKKNGQLGGRPSWRLAVDAPGVQSGTRVRDPVRLVGGRWRVIALVDGRWVRVIGQGELLLVDQYGRTKWIRPREDK